jgi:mitochondrial division protein 1
MESQINAIVASNNLMVAGTEDFKLRFIDLKSNKVVKTLIGHADAVSCLEFLGGGSNVMMSGGHDGAVRTWDLRTF